MAAGTAKKILIVEDEKEILDLVKMYLEKEGYRTCAALNGVDGLRQVKSEHPDLIILDLMLAEMDGLEVCKRIRTDPHTAMTPIIMLTAKAEESDMIVGLELGADDYVTKPFSPKALAMDLLRHEVTASGREVPLTAKEFGLLEHLLRNPGRVLTRDVLLNVVWGYEYYGTTRTVDVHIRRLKQKIPLLNDAIVSVKSLGYKLKEL